ncbi:MAG TPA: matrixin family metalloprotease [Candidatus Paceibacterota bacterium]|nr:matrixin family metalloprotease [Candidatus Paceibacterota bacterium]
MRLVATGLFIFLGSWLEAYGGVFRYNDAGQICRWNLDKSSPAIHTNSVNPRTKAIRFYIGSDGFSGVNLDAELNAVRACFAQWESVGRTRLRFEEGGLIAPPVDVNVNDHTNVVFWAKRVTLVNGGLDDISGALGYTYYRYSSDHTLLEADIVLNGVEFPWFCDFDRDDSESRFIEGVVLHEIGHWIGLDHSPVGGATMLARSLGGINAQVGLASDEICAVRHLYPDASVAADFSCLQGTILRNGRGVAGAVVIVEDQTGNVIQGTVSQMNGQYLLPALPPGTHAVRVCPLDPAQASSALLRGRDITSNPTFIPATDFRPTTNLMVNLIAGISKTLALHVEEGEPSFRISRIRPPTTNSTYWRVINAPASLVLGTRNVYIGVYGPNLPVSGAILSIDGDGLTLGPTLFQPAAFTGLNMVSTAVTVASNATPGLRTLRLTRGSDRAYANGFVEILPSSPDDNFDGLDDRFQRQYFPLFTAAEAHPEADPDQDGFPNFAEFWSGTDPTDPHSCLRIDRIRKTDLGMELHAAARPGKRYRLLSRGDGAQGVWTPVRPSELALDDFIQFIDPAPHESARYYRLEALP